MIMALLRAQLEEAKASASDDDAADLDLETMGMVVCTDSRPEISGALRRTPDKPGRGS
jgi:replication initiation protein RepC